MHHKRKNNKRKKDPIVRSLRKNMNPDQKPATGGSWGEGGIIRRWVRNSLRAWIEE